MTKELYNDSITVVEKSTSGKVRFEPFIGVSLRQYMRLFDMLERKDKSGNIMEWRSNDITFRYTEPIKPYNKEYQIADQISKILSDQDLELKKDKSVL